jgi:hypothetical protein
MLGILQRNGTFIINAPNAVDGERILSEDEKQWVIWRLFDLEEVDASRLNSRALRIGPFRTVSFEFVNGR